MRSKLVTSTPVRRPSLITSSSAVGAVAVVTRTLLSRQDGAAGALPPDDATVHSIDMPVVHLVPTAFCDLNTNNTTTTRSCNTNATRGQQARGEQRSNNNRVMRRGRQVARSTPAKPGARGDLASPRCRSPAFADDGGAVSERERASEREQDAASCVHTVSDQDSMLLQSEDKLCRPENHR